MVGWRLYELVVNDAGVEAVSMVVNHGWGMGGLYELVLNHGGVDAV